MQYTITRHWFCQYICVISYFLCKTPMDSHTRRPIVTSVYLRLCCLCRTQKRHHRTGSACCRRADNASKIAFSLDNIESLLQQLITTTAAGEPPQFCRVRESSTFAPVNRSTIPRFSTFSPTSPIPVSCGAGKAYPKYFPTCKLSVRRSLSGYKRGAHSVLPTTA